MRLLPESLFSIGFCLCSEHLFSGSETEYTYCSGCGARDRGTLGKITHGQKVCCVVCGREMKAAATGRYQYDMKSLAEWTKAAFLRVDEEGNLLIMTANVLWYYTQGNLRGDLQLETKAKYYLAPGKVQMWDRGEEYIGNGKWRPYARPTKTVGEGFADGYVYGYQEVNGTYHVIGLEKLEESNFRYSAAEIFFDRLGLTLEEGRVRWLISYLAQYAVRPQLEMAVKVGMREAAAELVEKGRVNSRFLDWKATTTAGFLRMGKADATAFLRAGMDLKELRFYQYSCGAGGAGGDISTSTEANNPGVDGGNTTFSDGETTYRSENGERRETGITNFLTGKIYGRKLNSYVSKGGDGGYYEMDGNVPQYKLPGGNTGTAFDWTATYGGHLGNYYAPGGSLIATGGAGGGGAYGENGGDGTDATSGRAGSGGAGGNSVTTPQKLSDLYSDYYGCGGLGGCGGGGGGAAGPYVPNRSSAGTGGQGGYGGHGGEGSDGCVLIFY